MSDSHQHDGTVCGLLFARRRWLKKLLTDKRL